MAHKFTAEIKDDYGTVKRFCKLNDINYKTYNAVCSGWAKSAPVVKVLIDHGYIESADELKRKSA